jgi:hypothetical protein
MKNFLVLLTLLCVPLIGFEGTAPAWNITNETNEPITVKKVVFNGYGTDKKPRNKVYQSSLPARSSMGEAASGTVTVTVLDPKGNQIGGTIKQGNWSVVEHNVSYALEQDTSDE